MEPSPQKSRLIPHEPVVPDGMRYCSEIAQGSLDTRLSLGELPPELEKAANLFSTHQRFELMQKCLVSSDRRAREAAVRVMSCYKDSVPALIESLQDNAWGVRAAAAQGLEQYPSSEAAAKLLPLLKDEIATVRLISAHTLGEMGALAKEALPALKEAAFGDPLLHTDPEEMYFLLPYCNVEVAKLGFEKAGKDRTDNWEQGTYQLYAIEAFEKISAALAQLVTEQTHLEKETISRSYPPATAHFWSVVDNLRNDDELAKLSNSMLMSVVTERFPPASFMAASMLGSRSAVEALPTLEAELLVKENGSFVHHVSAISRILEKHPSKKMRENLNRGLETLLCESDDASGAAEAAKLLSKHPALEARELLLKAIVFGNETGSTFALQNLFSIDFDPRSAQWALKKLKEHVSRASDANNTDRIRSATTHLTAQCER